MNYKGIDKEKILEVQKVKLHNADAYAVFTEAELKEICKGTDSFKRLYKGIENQLKARMDDTEMAIICEMAMKYLDEFKAMDDNKTEAYIKGLNDAWELAKKLWLPTSYGGKNSEEIMKIFGCDYYAISKLFTPQEAIAKLEAYEKEQEQKIVAGDIVTTINGECEYLVTSVQLPNTLHTVNTRNGYLQTMKISSAKKTGKHIDIQKILDELKEGAE